MIILDCETLENAITSVCEILCVDEHILVNTLTQVDFDKLYSINGGCSDFGDFILQYFIDKYNLQMKKLDRVCWFHLARTLKPDNFGNGILPLGNIAEVLFSSLYSLVNNEITESEWDLIIKNGPGGHNDWLFKMKMKGVEHHGPYAMLVKESAFNSGVMGNHDYLAIPEIVEDIAFGIEKNYGIDFRDRFIAESKSVIVKFWSEPDRKIENYVSPVLHYIHSKLNNQSLGLNCNTCFDAQNKIISASNILRIEILN